MDEAQHLADRVVVLAKGRVVAEGTPDELGGDDATVDRRFRVPLPRHCRCPRARPSSAASCRFRTATPTRDLAPLLELGRRARHGARSA